jgi:hypothetical protein
MPLILQPPEFQAVDSDGHPYAGGTINTYIPGTDTPKDTWTNHEGTALNSNPIILDAAGRAIIFGSGEYRFVLRDADGNLVYDQWTSSIVSDAMQPVVIAPTIAEAVRLLGIEDMINAAVAVETARATAAENSLQTQITNEVNRATAAETSLRNDLNAEIARAEAAEAALSARLDALEAGGGGSYAQIVTRYQQTTTLTVNVPSGKGVLLTVRADPGTLVASDPDNTVLQASGEFWRDGQLINNFGYVNTTFPPDYPAPPNYPWGAIDFPSAGSHTYTMYYFIHPDISASWGFSDWSAFSGTALCSILAEFV